MPAISKPSDYYSKVGAYYDDDVPHFEDIYCANPTLQRLRESFREETENFVFENALEIGFGLGMDIIHFAQKYPDRNFFGVDVSKRMYAHAGKKINELKLKNVQVGLGSVEDVAAIFPEQKFDLIYVYFGALNTVEDLSASARCLKNVLAPNGRIVVTAINKWYLAGILLPLVKGRFKIAFQRLKSNWGGYSPKRKLDSKCYSPSDLIGVFNEFRVLKKRGYSIAFPAWYQDNLRPRLGRIYNTLWKIDAVLNRTPLWSKGEYLLMVLQHR